MVVYFVNRSVKSAERRRSSAFFFFCLHLRRNSRLIWLIPIVYLPKTAKQTQQISLEKYFLEGLVVALEWMLEQNEIDKHPLFANWLGQWVFLDVRTYFVSLGFRSGYGASLGISQPEDVL